mgnify:CR=1 FL=1
MKTCSRCLIEKPFESYEKRKSRNTYRTVCKECKLARHRKRYAERKEDNPIAHRAKRLVLKCRQQGIECDITPEHLQALWTGKCDVSKLEISFDHHRVHDLYPEIDRFDPTKGYTKGNVRWLSRRMNNLKSNATIEELESILSWMKNYEPIYDEVESPVRKLPAWNKGMKMNPPEPELNGMKKIGWDDVNEIRARYNKGETIKSIAKDYPIGPSATRNIVRNKSWTKE